MQADEDNSLRADLRAAGLRATPARLAVLSVLRAASQSLTHQDVVDALAGKAGDRATIYRNLVTLVEAGFARRTDLGDHVWRFEAVQADGASYHQHPHFLCTACGDVSCMPPMEIKVFDGRTVPQAVHEQTIEVHLRGVCDSCR
ncbi:MAG: Fur family transcriptional regulator [Nannocystaceae bacterium]